MSLLRLGISWHQARADYKGRIFDARKDALDLEAEIRRRRRLGELGMLDQGKRTVEEVHDGWDEVHTESLSRATVQAYDYAWERLVQPKLGKLRLSEVTPQRIEKFMQELAKEGIGEASAEKGWVVLSSMFARAEAWGWVQRNPVRAARKPRKKNSRRVPRALTVEASCSSPR